MCLLHFIDKDFAACEKQRKLLPTAWPMVHQNLPTYLEKIRPTARTTISSSSSHLQKENNIILRQTLDAFNAVKVDNLNDIKTKITTVTLPSEFYLVNGKESGTFLYVKHVDSNPSVVASVICLQDLGVWIHARGKVCSNSRFAHLLTHDGKVQSAVDVVNLLACVKSLLLNDDTQDSVEQFEYLEIAADMIDSALLSTSYENN